MNNPLHAAYCDATAFEIRPNIAHERAWHEFQKVGYTVDDLRVVITYLRREINRGSRRPGCLRFSNLIGLGETAADRLNFFAEDLALARASRIGRASAAAPGGTRSVVSQPAPAHDPAISEGLARLRKELRP